MVSMIPTNFIINPEGNLTGQVLFIANTSFNSFWYGKNILFSLQAVDANGIPLNDILKTNPLNFTLTERDELITVNQSAKTRTRFTLELFVTPSQTDIRNFTPPQRFLVTLGGQEPPMDGNGGLKFGSGGVLSKVVGGFFGLLTLCLLTEKGRK